MNRRAHLIEYCLVIGCAAACVAVIASRIYAAVAPLLAGATGVLEGAAR